MSRSRLIFCIPRSAIVSIGTLSKTTASRTFCQTLGTVIEEQCEQSSTSRVLIAGPSPEYTKERHAVSSVNNLSSERMREVVPSVALAINSALRLDH